MHLRFKDFFFFWNPVSPKVVRIFTSSTFTDMLMERNTLMEYVYPKIKEYCREKHGLEYQVSVWLCLFLRTFDVMLMSGSLKFQQLSNVSTPQVVDMRWGVRDEMTDEHMTTVKILDQLNNVQELRHIWSWFVQGSLYEWTARLSEVLHGPKFHLFWGSKVGTHCIVFKEREILMFIVYPRYGYRPIPSEIDTAELALLRWYSP